MLDVKDRETLKNMAKTTNIVLPDLDSPPSRQSRLLIHGIIRINDELVTSSHLKPLVENICTSFSPDQLLELNKMRRDLVELEIRVFTHFNTLKF